MQLYTPYTVSNPQIPGSSTLKELVPGSIAGMVGAPLLVFTDKFLPSALSGKFTPWVLSLMYGVSSSMVASMWTKNQLLRAGVNQVYVQEGLYRTFTYGFSAFLSSMAFFYIFRTFLRSEEKKVCGKRLAEDVELVIAKPELTSRARKIMSEV